jgi:glycosyltransferase involved in cell wall biosynthesis
MPLLSVITAVHPPHAGWLETSGASILTQELPDGWTVEWCVQLDDGAEATFSDPRVQAASNQTKLGAAQSRNLAVARASGDVLMHLDADDVLIQGALMRILPLYDDTTTAWVAVRVDDLIDGSVVSRPHELSGAVEPGVVAARWLSDGHLPFHSVAFTARRDAFLDAGCYPALIAAEDVGLVLAVTDRYRGVVLEDTLAQYRKWSLQTTVASVPYADLRPLCVQLLADTVRARRPRRS